jgi:hypothetical protein
MSSHPNLYLSQDYVFTSMLIRNSDYTHKGLWLSRTCCVMVSVLASSVVDRGCEPRSGQTKDYEIDICWKKGFQLYHCEKYFFNLTFVKNSFQLNLCEKKMVFNLIFVKK